MDEAQRELINDIGFALEQGKDKYVEAKAGREAQKELAGKTKKGNAFAPLIYAISAITIFVVLNIFAQINGIHIPTPRSIWAQIVQSVNPNTAISIGSGLVFLAILGALVQIVRQNGFRRGH